MGKVIVIVHFLSYFTYLLGATLYPSDLTVEYLNQPQAVDSTNPRLGWILNAESNEDGSITKNQSQTAYQILAATDVALLKSRKPDLWDSTKVQSDNTINVRYQGKALEPGQRVFWTVRVWDQKGESSEYVKVSVNNSKF